MLSGNCNLGSEMLTQIGTKIDAKLLTEARIVRPLNKNEVIANQTNSAVAEYKKWMELKEGLKMRDIMQSLNMNKVVLSPVTGEAKPLSVTRKLGFEAFVQHTGWTIDTTKNDCWVHHKHSFTVLFWNPRLGQMASVSEQES